MTKLVLGTVQFGCQYGINSAGRPDEKMVLDILKCAAESGISVLDTSAAYGNAEEVLGKLLPHFGSSFRVISKYSESEETVTLALDKTLQTLGVSQIYGYLLHHFNVYCKHPEVWAEFRKQQEKGKVLKIGFSIYSPEELKILLENKVPFDLIQFPYNLFDRQFEPYLELLKERGVEIHVRSTFLQGLFFRDRDHLPEKLQPLGRYLKQLDSYARSQNMTVAEVALNYNLQNPLIDGVLIGVDNVEQLEKNFGYISDKKVGFTIEIAEKELLNPVNWQ